MYFVKHGFMIGSLVALAVSVSGCPHSDCGDPMDSPMETCSVLAELVGTWVSDDEDIDFTIEFNGDGSMEGNGTFIPCCSVRMVATWEACGIEPLAMGTLELLTSFLGHPCCPEGAIDPPELRESTYMFADMDTILITGLFNDPDDTILFTRQEDPGSAQMR